jgi:archaellum biogenesis ATPase FlaH
VSKQVSTKQQTNDKASQAEKAAARAALRQTLEDAPIKHVLHLGSIPPEANDLLPGDFFHESSKAIWAAFIKLSLAGMTIDQTILALELPAQSMWLASITPEPCRDLLTYITKIKRLRTEDLVTDTLVKAANEMVTAPDLDAIQILIGKLSSLTLELGGERPMVLSEAIYEVLQAGGLGHALPAVCIPGFTERFGEFCRGDLIGIAAPSEGGKSLIAQYILLGWAKAGVKVVFHSLEMTLSDVTRRAAAMEGLKLPRSGAFTEGQVDGLQEIASQTFTDNILIDPREMTGDGLIANIRARAAMGYDAFAIDHSLLLDHDEDSQGENYTRVIERYADKLKKVAKSLGVVIILLNQVTIDRIDYNALPSSDRLRWGRGVKQAMDMLFFIVSLELFKPGHVGHTFEIHPWKLRHSENGRPDFLTFEIMDGRLIGYQELGV